MHSDLNSVQFCNFKMYVRPMKGRQYFVRVREVRLKDIQKWQCFVTEGSAINTVKSAFLHVTRGRDMIVPPSEYVTRFNSTYAHPASLVLRAIQVNLEVLCLDDTEKC